jgi:hypothetical protein
MLRGIVLTAALAVLTLVTPASAAPVMPNQLRMEVGTGVVQVRSRHAHGRRHVGSHRHVRHHGHRHFRGHRGIYIGGIHRPRRCGWVVIKKGHHVKRIWNCGRRW